MAHFKGLAFVVYNPGVTGLSGRGARFRTPTGKPSLDIFYPAFVADFSVLMATNLSSDLNHSSAPNE